MPVAVNLPMLHVSVLPLGVQSGEDEDERAARCRNSDDDVVDVVSAVVASRVSTQPVVLSGFGFTVPG